MSRKSKKADLVISEIEYTELVRISKSRTES